MAASPPSACAQLMANSCSISTASVMTSAWCRVSVTQVSDRRQCCGCSLLVLSCPAHRPALDRNCSTNAGMFSAQSSVSDLMCLLEAMTSACGCVGLKQEWEGADAAAAHCCSSTLAPTPEAGIAMQMKLLPYPLPVPWSPNLSRSMLHACNACLHVAFQALALASQSSMACQKRCKASTSESQRHAIHSTDSCMTRGGMRCSQIYRRRRGCGSSARS